MDRLSHLRGEAGGSRDSTLDTTSPPSEAFMTANESSSKYFSLSEVDSVDSTFDISSIKDVSLPSTTSDSESTMANADELISKLSPIGKKSDMLGSYKIGKQIEAANILSGGVDIFDDNDNSYDGDELVIDDNIDDDKSNSELKQPEEMEFKSDENMIESTLINEETDIASKDTEVVLQIDGKNVDAIDIGNGLYLYRKEGQEELAAVQIIDDDQQQTSFKFLKVRENAEGNLEVYEEIEIEVPKEVPAREGKMADKKISSHVPIKDINKVISESASNKVADRKVKAPRNEPILTTKITEVELEVNKETPPDGKSEFNINGKMMKFSESRKSPVIGSFTPMTYHSTPNKERIPLTKTMVEQQLHPNRHSDNVKKTIEVHTDSSKQRTPETPTKQKDDDDNKSHDLDSPEKDMMTDESLEKVPIEEVEENENKIIEKNKIGYDKPLEPSNEEVLKEKSTPNDTSDQIKQDNTIDSTKIDVTKLKPILNENIQAEIVYEDKKEVMIENIMDIDEDMTEDLVIVETVAETVETVAGTLKTVTETVEIVANTVETIAETVETVAGTVETASETVETAAETVVGKDEAKDLLKNDSEKVEKVNDETKKCQGEVKISEPIQVINKNDECDATEQSDKAVIVKVNTQCDKQDETKAEEIIYDITDQEHDDIIIINDSELDDNKIEETTSLNSKVNITSNDQENEKVVSNVASKNVENESKVKEIFQDSNKKHVENVHTAVILNTHKEQTKKDETSKEGRQGDIVKNNHSRIPTAKSKTKKEVTKPTNNETTITIKSSTAVDVKEVELKSTSSKEKGSGLKEVVKDILNTKLSQPIITLEESQKPLKTEKPQIIPEVPANKTSLHISPFSITKTETAVLKRETNVFEKSPKKEPQRPIPITESQSKIVPMKVDSTAKVKAETSGQSQASSGKVPCTEVKKQPVTQEPVAGTSFEVKPQETPIGDTKREIKITPKASTSGELNVKVSQVPKEEQPSCSGTQDVSSTSTDSLQNNDRNEGEYYSEEPKPGGSKKAVPFGKWTATNRKEFLDKIKNRNTTPAPAAVPSTSTNQLKSSNDLNRRDVLQKIDSQRQQSSSAAAALAKAQEGNKVVKNETAFVSKANQLKDNNTQETKSPLKVDTGKETFGAEAETVPIKKDVSNDIQNEGVSEAASATSLKKEAKVTEVNYQDLIDKTIEDMIQRTVGTSKAVQDEPNQTSARDAPPTGKFPTNYKPTDHATLDEIEMKMNELHGIPFIERPPHELPVVPLAEPKHKTNSKVEKEKPSVPVKTSKLPNLLPFTNKTHQKIIKESVIEVDSEDEIIEHEPITGDININKKTVAAKLPPKEKILSNANTDKCNSLTAKKEPIITEKDFDKFARRNSITYENCLTMNFDSKDPHNVIQTVVEKDPYPKTYSRSDVARVDKPKMPFKYQNARQPIQPAKVHTANKLSATEDLSSRNQSKLQKAYQSALSAKRQKECPITIIEDKPVKVVFMDNMEYVPSSLNIQGQQLSPAKKQSAEPDSFTLSTLDSIESDVLDATDEAKSQEVKTKTKHQRKQVLTPVNEPELELIQPIDLGLEVSPKKKRKADDDRMDKNMKYPMRKKYYLLGSNTAAEDKYTHSTEIIKNPLKETVNRNDNGVAHKNAVSAIDSLVKAAELLEHQSENMNIIDSPIPDSQQSTPVKRGRGRPRKYPLPEEGVEQKVPSPQKKPRLIDAKVPKRDTVMTSDDEDDDIDSDGQMIKENWTMGKINENIVCPICNKLFRTENVVFKHVKHCTGPSPSRSGSDKRSPRRMRPSQESESQGSKSDDMDLDDDKPLVVRKETPKKSKSNDSICKSGDKDDIIVIEDTPPAKEKAEKKEKEVDERKIHESRKPRAKIFPKTNNLVCEFCGKTFRQLSYLVNHKLQHKKDEPKKIEKEAPVANKSVYSCEVCKKEFRKLHHLVQHRIIHNSSAAPARSLRKSSSEQSDTKIEKEPITSKLSEDTSAGFRCEPCDKSFRKLHHLVEHRETHDGINRQKTTPTVVPNNVEKSVTSHQCEVCKKTFRKLSHLIEHKEQHVETSSEKSDDKSVKSSLSTRDIIHECSLCYMVFPNEHSLNKHTIICQRKKRQSKQAKAAEECEATAESVEDASESPKIEEKLEGVDSPKLVIIEDIIEEQHKMEVVEKIELPKDVPKPAEEKPVEVVNEAEKENELAPQKIEIKPVEPPVIPAKREFSETEVRSKSEAKPEVLAKIKKVEIKEAVKVRETPKKKTSIKEKSKGNASRRLKATAPVAIPEETKATVESSDDDEVRYMLNPNFKVEESAEGKVFMKLNESKRDSLQIERPNSKDLVKSRTSLQHPPKIPRLKPKAVEPNPVAVKHIAKAPKLEPVPSTDSDDSETVKYSFPKTIPEKTSKPPRERTPKSVERKTQKKSLADKRKSLSGIAKRKSLGKAVTARHKATPVKQIKRRTLEVEHRCDCGQLFSSAALLSRHTTLAHTPPRLRTRRSPPPDDQPADRKPSVANKPKQVPVSRKSSAQSDSTNSTNTKPNKNEAKPTRKTLDKETKIPAGTRKSKPEKSEAKSNVKPKRTPVDRGVPVPDKMRKTNAKK